MRCPPAPDALRAVIDVLAFDLDDPALHDLRALSDPERRRADALATESAARRFVAARVGLRRLLGHRLQVAPHRVALGRGPYGKPCIDPGCSPRDLRFNLAHSEGRAVLACADGFEVGVDLECPLAGVDIADLSASVLSPRERGVLAGLSEPERAEAFHRCWVRKEAVLKALGTGLAVPPHRVDTGSMDARGCGSVDVDVAGSESSRLWWRDVALPDPVGACAVACGHPAFEVSCMRAVWS